MAPSSSQLETLKNIAELLNQSTDKKVMKDVLAAFISMTHFETGWVFLEREDGVHLEADVGLPPALSKNDKELMCGEDCYCVSRYKKGKLTQATSIIACKRIEKALRKGSKETCGITHHATVPLQTPNKLYGLFNVAARNRQNYSEELELLESIALQLGTALERMERFEKEEIRSNLLTKAHLFTKEIQQSRDSVSLRENVAKYMKVVFGEVSVQYTPHEEQEQYSLGRWLNDKYYLKMVRNFSFSSQEKEIFNLLMDYSNIAWKQLLLSKKEKDLARREERSQLAQDLHDSVNQLLFSIVLTSKGAGGLISAESPAYEQIQYIHQMSSRALKEMRSLIANEKEDSMEGGVFVELYRYAQTIGVTLKGHSEGTQTIPYFIEEALLRIGQEALNNVYKHSGSQEARLEIKKFSDKVQLIISDQGRGFNQKEASQKPSYGLSGMEDRAYSYNGTIKITSDLGKGTVIVVELPIEVKKNDH
ncbi:GAF domain-containing sensor histidine kinase [Halobacillus salinarum]|uniref:histidine kinase n=1 Tax=Halobacillus salinarum TaxID=2932257 RepID=A0ABY4EHN5_9BACI|nr:GAF domain-containing sensor histidine kinase [Halobacillus salinarum]UOQ43587.1 GAF domain-containing sensor histidine kinase [Halobacillus salinarum]